MIPPFGGISCRSKRSGQRKIPMTAIICSPLALARSDKPPVALSKTSLSELCERAEIPLRVTGGQNHEIVLHEGEAHFSIPGTYYVGVGALKLPTRVRALQILEILAHGFHDYAARECVCNQGLFSVPAKRGRPRLHAAPMTPQQRMKKMRSRRSAGLGGRDVL